MAPNVSGLKIAITGGAGFIGSHTVLSLIEQGHEVRVLDNLDPKIHPAGDAKNLSSAATLIVGDVRDSAAIEHLVDGCDVVYHFASETGVGEGELAAARYYDVNVKGTVELWAAIVGMPQRPRQVILASSRAVYGEGALECAACGPQVVSRRNEDRLSRGLWVPNCPVCGEDLAPMPTREDWPRRPVSVYGFTKQLQEDLSTFYAGQLGISLTILRYFNVYGPGQSLSNPYTGILTHFTARILRGIGVELYEDGEPTRDYVHIDDVVRVNVASIDLTSGSRCVNVGTGVSSSLVELVDGIRDVGAKRDCEARLTSKYRLGDIYAGAADTNLCRAMFPDICSRPMRSIRSGLTTVIEWLASTDLGGMTPLESAERILADSGVLRSAGPRPAGS